MKKTLPLLFTIISMLVSPSVFSQQTEDERKHELKFNAFNIVVFKALDVSYEHIYNANSTFGISVLANLQSKPGWLSDRGEMPYYYERFAITPYYRHFFMNRYAKGFFLEAFGMVNSQRQYREIWNETTYDVHYETLGPSNNFAIGIAVGGKIVSRKNFLFEFFGGVGRNLIQSDRAASTEFVPRVGINLGYRF